MHHILSLPALVVALGSPGSAAGPWWSPACTRTNEIASLAAFSSSEARALRAWPDQASTVSSQIPERAASEITFAQVEAAAGWADLRTAPPDTFEVRVMDRHRQSFAPVPLLRMVGADGTVHAQLFVFWGRTVSPSARPQGDDIRCRDGVCVKPIDLVEQRDWEKVAASLARQSDCPGKQPVITGRTADGGLHDRATLCDHCPMVYVKSFVDGKYREQVCDDPLPHTEAAALRALMMASAEAAGRKGM